MKRMDLFEMLGEALRPQPDLFTAMGLEPLQTIPQIHAKGYTPSEQDTRRIARSASAMNAKVLALFRDNPDTAYIAPEVHAIVGGLLTSVRRTLTDLMNEGLLVKTGNRRKGAFGVENCEYKLKAS